MTTRAEYIERARAKLTAGEFSAVYAEGRKSAPVGGKRPKREVETSDFAGIVARLIRAHGKRVADADPEDLVDLIALQDTLDAAIAAAVAGQRAHGASWADIARGTGATRQAAYQRWGQVSA